MTTVNGSPNVSGIGQSRIAFIQALAEERAFKRLELLTLLQQPQTLPRNVIGVDLLGQDATGRDLIALRLNGWQHITDKYGPIILPIYYGPPLWLAHLYGGAIGINGRTGFQHPDFIPYARCGTDNLTLASVIANARHGKRTTNYRCADPLNLSRPELWLTDPREGQRGAGNPRLALVEKAASMFSENASETCPLSEEEYKRTIHRWFDKADHHYHQARRRALSAA